MKPIAVSMGEPAGIGPEIIVKAWLARQDEALPPFFVCGDGNALLDAKPRGAEFSIIALAAHGLNAMPDSLESALPVCEAPLAVPARAGHLDPANARAVIFALETATNACMQGHASALVTAPIQKSTLYDAGFEYPGHTEYLEARFAGAAQAPESLMLLAGGGLKVALVTIHVAIRDVAPLITQAALMKKARILHSALQKDFGIAQPRIAVAALNPHGGEDGALGREEFEVIAPAVRGLIGTGLDASGPFPADTLFHEQARSKYDAVLCMYHDQALIPLKTLDFYSGVNVTLGLPIVRTSPDHGTALDIAGKGIADARSFIAALKLASEIAQRRGTA